ncbi:hypothetical protein [Halomontanus rarus]|uniref:hypothetical protein n=1 Tax=Halomontanus rarus TaxID=3034020 RepID=UPI001A98A6BB
MSQTDDSTTVTLTNHPRVFYESLQLDRGEFEVATAVADALGKDWQVRVTIGPYRAHSLTYDIDADARTVNLDFYSARPRSGYTIEQVINDIAEDIQ